MTHYVSLRLSFCVQFCIVLLQDIFPRARTGPPRVLILYG